MLSWFCLQHFCMLYFLEFASSLKAHFSFFVLNSILFLLHGCSKPTYMCCISFFGVFLLPLHCLCFLQVPFFCFFWLLYFPLEPSFHACWSLTVHLYFKSGDQNADWAPVQQERGLWTSWYSDSLESLPFFHWGHLEISAYRSFLWECWVFPERSVPGGVIACLLLLLGALMGKEAGYPVWYADFHSVHLFSESCPPSP